MSVKPINNCVENGSVFCVKFSIPPFRYYLVISFLLTSLLVVLDGIYRSEAFLIDQPFFMLIENGIFLWVFLFTTFIPVSLLLWGGDAVITVILNGIKWNGTSENTTHGNFVSSFIYYILFAYINIIYFRLYLSAFIPGMRANGILKGAVLLSSISVAIALILYLAVFKTFLEKHILRKITPLVFKGILIVTIILSITGFVLYGLAGDNSFPASDSGSSTVGNKPHVIFITLDNVRNNSMSLYGYARKTTPFLEEFAQESTVFNNMMAVSTETMICMPAIITGKYPVKKFPFPKTFFADSLPEILMKNGYEKTIFLSPLSMNMFPRKIFSEYLILNSSTGDPMRAFSYLGKSRKHLLWLSYFLSEDERFFNVFHHRDPRDISFRQTQTIMTEAYEYMIDSLKSSDKPVFVWAHFLETHSPYNPPPALKKYFKGSPDPEVDKYDACIRYSDYELSNFIGRLKVEGLYDNCLIIISSDHGCYFPFESKENEAMISSYPDTLSSAYLRLTSSVVNVPLIIHEPGQKTGIKVRAIAGHADIAPTILGLLNLDIPPGIEGESMVLFMRNSNSTGEQIKISIPAQYQYRWNRMAFEGIYSLEFEIFSVYYDHYVFELAQLQFKKVAKGEKIEKIFSRKLPYTILGVYDLDKDRQRTNNLKDLPKSKRLIDRILQSKWVKYYGEIDNPQDGI